MNITSDSAYPDDTSKESLIKQRRAQFEYIDHQQALELIHSFQGHFRPTACQALIKNTQREVLSRLTEEIRVYEQLFRNRETWL